MNTLIDVETATFPAICKNCGNKFDFPCFGDFAYGQFIFNTEDGKSFVYYESSTPIELLFKVLLPENPGAELYQTALAEFADPVFGSKVTRQFYCPLCKSDDIENLYGTKTGSMWVKPVTYNRLQRQSRAEIIQSFSKFISESNV